LIMDSWTGLGLMGRVESAMVASAIAQMAAELYPKPSNVFGPVAAAAHL